MKQSKRRIGQMILPLGISIGIMMGCSVEGDRPSPPNPSLPDTTSSTPSLPDSSPSEPSQPSPSQPDISSPIPSDPIPSDPIPSDPIPSDMEETMATLTCSGRITDGPEFTAYYTPGNGFSRIDLGTSQNHITTTLSFSNYDANGQAVWQGYAFDRARVTLVAPSRDTVEAGDEVSVSYDTRWGRGVCVPV